MPILVSTRIVQGSQEDLGRVGERVEAAIMEVGAPPLGLMVHVAHPDGDGYVVREVWRNEEEMRGFYNAVLLPSMSAVGLTPEASVIQPVWSFARP